MAVRRAWTDNHPSPPCLRAREGPAAEVVADIPQALDALKGASKSRRTSRHQGRRRQKALMKIGEAIMAYQTSNQSLSSILGILGGAFAVVPRSSPTACLSPWPWPSGVFPEGGNSGGECGAPWGRGGEMHGVRGASGGVPARGPGVSPDLCPPRAPLAPCFHPPETLRRIPAKRTSSKSPFRFLETAEPTDDGARPSPLARGSPGTPGAAAPPASAVPGRRPAWGPARPPGREGETRAAGGEEGRGEDDGVLWGTAPRGSAAGAAGESRPPHAGSCPKACSGWSSRDRGLRRSADRACSPGGGPRLAEGQRVCFFFSPGG